MDSRWYAVHVRSGGEFATSESLQHRGYEVFLPSYRQRRRLSDRIKTMDAALFPGYLFCRVQPGVSGLILSTPGVISLVGAGRTPLPVEEEEIVSLRRTLETRAGEPWPFPREGRTVRIEEGPFRGVCGVVVRIKNECKLVVSITLLQRSVAVELDADAATPLDGDPQRALHYN
jgi:transcription antitermination factor NusG